MYQAKREHWVVQERVKFFGITGLGHSNVVRLQITVHRQGKQHDVKQSTFEHCQIKVIQAVAHVADVGGADNAIACERSTDWRERFQGRSIEHFSNRGRVFVGAFHQQKEVFSQRRNVIGKFSPLD